MNVEHSDVRTCTQDVYSCFVKHLLRDLRQQHPQSFNSLLYKCGHITEDYDQNTKDIRYPHFSGDARTDCPGRFSSPAKNGLGTRLGYDAFAAASHSLYSDLLSSAFMEVDPLATTQSVSSTLNLPLQWDMFPLTCNVSVVFFSLSLNCNHSYACLSLCVHS